MIRIHHVGGTRGLRIVWQCEEMGLPYEIVPATLPPSDAYRALNPMAALPFLEDAGGIGINESVAMMIYLATKYGPTPLLPDMGDPAYARVLQMTVFGEASIGMNITPIQIARLAAPEEDKRNWSVRLQEVRVARAIKYVSGMLGVGSYLAADRFTLADISVGYILNAWASAFAKTLPDNLTAYLTRLAERPAYQRALAAK